MQRKWKQVIEAVHDANKIQHSVTSDSLSLMQLISKYVSQHSMSCQMSQYEAQIDNKHQF